MIIAVRDSYPKKCAFFRYCVVAMRTLIVFKITRAIHRIRRTNGSQLVRWLNDSSRGNHTSLKLTDLADALPLQILLPNLSVDHDLLVLEQDHHVRAAEEKEAELVALLQPGANLGRQVD